jgi:hypothetical protein
VEKLGSLPEEEGSLQIGVGGRWQNLKAVLAEERESRENTKDVFRCIRETTTKRTKRLYFLRLR